MEGRALTEEEMDIQTCTAHHNTTSSEGPMCSEIAFVGNSTTSFIEEDTNTQNAKDYTVFLSALTAFIALFNVAMILFFNAPFKRSIANKSEPKDTS
jgi:hypothetical protein